MSKITFKRDQQTVTVNADQAGTIRILEAGGFTRQQPQLSWDELALSANVIAALRANFATPRDALQADDQALLAVTGIGRATVRSIRELATALL